MDAAYEHGLCMLYMEKYWGCFKVLWWNLHHLKEIYILQAVTVDGLSAVVMVAHTSFYCKLCLSGKMFLRFSSKLEDFEELAIISFSCGS